MHAIFIYKRREGKEFKGRVLKIILLSAVGDGGNKF
jgi:hypothetical protein